MSLEYFNVNELWDSETLLQKIPNSSGIYLFTNKLNDKCYVGQAVNIIKRLKSHKSNFLHKTYDNPLYRAMQKYGLNNFTYSIIKIVSDLDIKELKAKLDKLEIYYIQEYNSYAPNGYNQTLGGDGGILGYKFTEEQREKQGINTRNRYEETMEYKLYVYSIDEKKLYTFVTSTDADKYFKWKSGTSRNSLPRITVGRKYILGRTLKEIKLKYNYFNSESYNKSLYSKKYSLEEYQHIRSENPNASVEQLSSIMGVCKKTISNYNKQLGICDRKTLKVKITNTETNKVIIVDIKQGAEFFNTSDKNFRKTVDRCNNDKHLYRKIYRLEKIYENRNL